MNEIAPEILEKAAKGDLEAFEAIYKQLSGFVYNVALRITRNGMDAEEVTQDVFMKIYHKLNNFQFRSAFRTWVYRITVNTAINNYNQTRRNERERADYDAAIDSIPAENSTLAAVSEHDNEAKANALLNILPEAFRTCFILRAIEGLSYQEIAATLKIPINTVRSRLKRARQALLLAGRKGLA